MNNRKQLMLLQVMSFVFLVIGACLIGSQHGQRMGYAAFLLVWALLPTARE